MRRTRESNKDLARAASKQAKPKREYYLYNCPKGKRARGFSDYDSACSECHSIDECKTITLKRALKSTLNVMDDLNRKLLHVDPFEFHDGKTSYWNLVEDPSCIDGKWLDELREQIKTKIQNWCKDQEEDNSDTIQEDVAKLHKATLRVLDNIWPEWKKWTGQFLEKTHVLDTEKPERLTWSLRIPYYIMDSYMNKMSASAWKIFSYIARRSTFDPERPNFGKCFLKYEEIQKRTGVKTVAKYVKELENLGLIELIQQQKTNFSTGGVVTINTFKVKWFGEFSKLGVVGYMTNRQKYGGSY